MAAPRSAADDDVNHTHSTQRLESATVQTVQLLIPPHEGRKTAPQRRAEAAANAMRRSSHPWATSTGAALPARSGMTAFVGSPPLHTAR
jgi:hypothetical protein